MSSAIVSLLAYPKMDAPLLVKVEVKQLVYNLDSQSASRAPFLFLVLPQLAESDLIQSDQVLRDSVEFCSNSLHTHLVLSLRNTDQYSEICEAFFHHGAASSGEQN